MVQFVEFVVRPLEKEGSEQIVSSHCLGTRCMIVCDLAVTFTIKMTRKTKDDTFQQKSLFDLDQDEQLSPPPKIDDAGRDNLLLAMMMLASIKGVGFTTLCSLFDAQVLHHVWEWDSATFVKNLTYLPDKQKKALVEGVLQRRTQIEDEGQRVVEALREQQIFILPRGHRDYPEALLRLLTPPRWVFAKGNTDALHAEAIIGVVGTRKPSPGGEKLAYRFAKELAYRGAVVLSGLAKGIDENAHLGAVEHYGQSIAILGHGLNMALAKSSEKLVDRIIETNGVVISEYLPSERASRERYLRRNELQAALSKAIVPVECPTMSSGTGATIRRAMKIGTEVIGIVSGRHQDRTLLATRENLERLNAQVFTVLSQNSTDLWDYLQRKVPSHDWSGKLGVVQDRFFATIVQQILDKEDALSLDDKAISRFIEMLQGQFEDN